MTDNVDIEEIKQRILEKNRKENAHLMSAQGTVEEEEEEEDLSFNVNSDGLNWSTDEESWDSENEEDPFDTEEWKVERTKEEDLLFSLLIDAAKKSKLLHRIKNDDIHDFENIVITGNEEAESKKAVKLFEQAFAEHINKIDDVSTNYKYNELHLLYNDIGNTLLHEATFRDCAILVEKILRPMHARLKEERELLVNQPSHHSIFTKYTALHFAARSNNYQILKMLFYCKADGNLLTKDGKNIFHISFSSANANTLHSSKSIGILQLYFKNKINVLQPDFNNIIPMFLIASSGSLEQIRQLVSLSNKFKLRKQLTHFDFFGNTALHHAFQIQLQYVFQDRQYTLPHHHNVAFYLATLGANILQANMQGTLATDYAVDSLFELLQICSDVYSRTNFANLSANEKEEIHGIIEKYEKNLASLMKNRATVSNTKVAQLLEELHKDQQELYEIENRGNQKFCTLISERTRPSQNFGKIRRAELPKPSNKFLILDGTTSDTVFSARDGEHTTDSNNSASKCPFSGSKNSSSTATASKCPFTGKSTSTAEQAQPKKASKCPFSGATNTSNSSASKCPVATNSEQATVSKCPFLHNKQSVDEHAKCPVTHKSPAELSEDSSSKCSFLHNQSSVDENAKCPVTHKSPAELMQQTSASKCPVMHNTKGDNNNSSSNSATKCPFLHDETVDKSATCPITNKSSVGNDKELANKCPFLKKDGQATISELSDKKCPITNKSPNDVLHEKDATKCPHLQKCSSTNTTQHINSNSSEQKKCPFLHSKEVQEDAKCPVTGQTVENAKAIASNTNSNSSTAENDKKKCPFLHSASTTAVVEDEARCPVTNTTKAELLASTTDDAKKQCPFLQQATNSTAKCNNITKCPMQHKDNNGDDDKK